MAINYAGLRSRFLGLGRLTRIGLVMGVALLLAAPALLVYFQTTQNGPVHGALQGLVNALFGIGTALVMRCAFSADVSRKMFLFAAIAASVPAVLGLIIVSAVGLEEQPWQAWIALVLGGVFAALGLTRLAS